MSQKILETAESILVQMSVPDDVADFVRNIIAFECYEKTHHFKKRYKEELSKLESSKEA